MPFMLRPYSRFPVNCAVTYNGGLTTGGLVNQKWFAGTRHVVVCRTDGGVGVTVDSLHSIAGEITR